MKLRFNIEVYPFYNEITFNITDGENIIETITEKYTNAMDDWGSFMFNGKQYDWNISHSWGADVQELVSIYPVDMETFQTDVFKPLKNKWVRLNF